MATNSVTVQKTNKGQRFITLPSGIADLKGWGKGTILEFIEDQRTGGLILKKKVFEEGSLDVD